MIENDPRLSVALLWNNEEAATLSLSLLFYSFQFPSCFKSNRSAEQFALGSQLIPRLKHRLSPFLKWVCRQDINATSRDAGMEITRFG